MILHKCFGLFCLLLNPALAEHCSDSPGVLPITFPTKESYNPRGNIAVATLSINLSNFSESADDKKLIIQNLKNDAPLLHQLIEKGEFTISYTENNFPQNNASNLGVDAVAVATVDEYQLKKDFPGLFDQQRSSLFGKDNAHTCPEPIGPTVGPKPHNPRGMGWEEMKGEYPKLIENINTYILNVN